MLTLKGTNRSFQIKRPFQKKTPTKREKLQLSSTKVYFLEVLYDCFIANTIKYIFLNILQCHILHWILKYGCLIIYQTCYLFGEKTPLFSSSLVLLVGKMGKKNMTLWTYGSRGERTN